MHLNFIDLSTKWKDKLRASFFHGFDAATKLRKRRQPGRSRSMALPAVVLI